MGCMHHREHLGLEGYQSRTPKGSAHGTSLLCGRAGVLHDSLAPRNSTELRDEIWRARYALKLMKLNIGGPSPFPAPRTDASRALSLHVYGSV